MYTFLEIPATTFVLDTKNLKVIMFLGSKVRRVHRADNLTVICDPIV
jgi:hypothetical protein